MSIIIHDTKVWRTDEPGGKLRPRTIEILSCANCGVLFQEGKRPPTGVSWLPICTPECSIEWTKKNPLRYPQNNDEMGMNEYQKLAEVAVVYPPDLSVIYPTIGLAGETGEVCEKVKKWIRDADRKPMTQEQLALLKKELGDVLWYLAVLAKDLGLTLDEIATHNIEKLHDRKERGVVHGQGDIR